MDIREMLGTIREALVSTRVFSEPYEIGGLTIITASYVRGGGGGGGGSRQGGAQEQGQEPGAGEDEGQASSGEGSGGGFGLVAGPAGAYVIKDGSVAWQPAVDVNRIVLGGQLVVVVVALTLGRLLRKRMRRWRR